MNYCFIFIYHQTTKIKKKHEEHAMTLCNKWQFHEKQKHKLFFFGHVCELFYWTRYICLYFYFHIYSIVRVVYFLFVCSNFKLNYIKLFFSLRFISQTFSLCRNNIVNNFLCQTVSALTIRQIHTQWQSN